MTAEENARSRGAAQSPRPRPLIGKQSASATKVAAPDNNRRPRQSQTSTDCQAAGRDPVCIQAATADEKWDNARGISHTSPKRGGVLVPSLEGWPKAGVGSFSHHTSDRGDRPGQVRVRLSLPQQEPANDEPRAHQHRPPVIPQGVVQFFPLVGHTTKTGVADE